MSDGAVQTPGRTRSATALEIAGLHLACFVFAFGAFGLSAAKPTGMWLIPFPLFAISFGLGVARSFRLAVKLTFVVWAVVIWFLGVWCVVGSVMVWGGFFRS